MNIHTLLKFNKLQFYFIFTIKISELPTFIRQLSFLSFLTYLAIQFGIEEYIIIC